MACWFYICLNWMTLNLSDNFHFNFIFTSDKFRDTAPFISFRLNILFILNLTWASELGNLIVAKMLPKKLGTLI